MRSPTTILLVPPEGSTLLEDPCAPVMVLDGDDRWLTTFDVLRRNAMNRWHGDDEEDVDDMPHALVLAQDGRVQRHGCLALAAQVAVIRPFHAAAMIAEGVKESLREGEHGRLEGAVSRLPGARLVFLDAEGKEIVDE